MSVLNIHWKHWCWSWNFNSLATWCEKLTRWKRHWFWERLKAGGEWDDRGWDGWMASPTQWTWVWVNSWSWWWTWRPGVLHPMMSQTAHDWVTELIDMCFFKVSQFCSICMCLCLCGNHTSSVTITFEYCLKFGSVMTQNLFLLEIP